MLGVVVLAALALLHFLGVIDDADFLMKTKKKKHKTVMSTLTGTFGRKEVVKLYDFLPSFPNSYP